MRLPLFTPLYVFPFVRVVAAGEPRLTLKQKLTRFDRERHGLLGGAT